MFFLLWIRAAACFECDISFFVAPQRDWIIIHLSRGSWLIFISPGHRITILLTLCPILITRRQIEFALYTTQIWRKCNRDVCVSGPEGRARRDEDHQTDRQIRWPKAITEKCYRKEWEQRGSKTERNKIYFLLNDDHYDWDNCVLCYYAGIEFWIIFSFFTLFHQVEYTMLRKVRKYSTFVVELNKSASISGFSTYRSFFVVQNK